MKKKLIVLLFISILSIAITGCINQNTKTKKNENKNSTEAKKETPENLGKIYTNYTKSTKLIPVKMGILDDSEQSFEVLTINVPNHYLINSLEYASAIQTFASAKVDKYESYTFNTMKDTAEQIETITNKGLISKINLSDYATLKVDKATVISTKLYSNRGSYSAYFKKETTIKNKKIYYSFYEDSTLGPSISGYIIIKGEAKTEQSMGKNALNTNHSLFLYFELSNPNLKEDVSEEYLQELMNFIQFSV